MSSLIVMPGSEEFKKTLASIAKAPSRRKLVQPVDLVGHTLMLNTALVKTFQCGGFVLGPNRPIGIVDEQSQQIPIRKALEEKKLIDVTGKDMATKGFKGTGGQTSAITEEDTGKKVFVGRDRRGTSTSQLPDPRLKPSGSSAKSGRLARSRALTSIPRPQVSAPLPKR